LILVSTAWIDRKCVFESDAPERRRLPTVSSYHVEVGAGQHPFKFRTRPQRLFVFRVGANPHHLFHARAVELTSVEQNNFARQWKLEDILLEIPLRLFVSGRGSKRRHHANSWVRAFRDAVDDAAASRGIALFEQHNDFDFFDLHPLFQLNQLNPQL